jgi:hypothetical protein
MTGASFTVVDDGTVASGTKTIDWSAGIKHKFAQNVASCTLSFTAPAGPANVQLEITHQADGQALTWPGTVKWPGGTAPTLSGNGKIDMVTLWYDGTNYLGMYTLNF